jgi:hypothetical protein
LLEASYATHGGWQVNLGDGQQPLPQIWSVGQWRCFLQLWSELQMPPASRQTPPPPGFLAQKQVAGHPVPPTQNPLTTLNGSPHVGVQVRWTQACPVWQSLLRRQDWALASRPPNPRSVPSVPAVSPPSTCRRGRRVQALVIASKRVAFIAGPHTMARRWLAAAEVPAS